MSKSLCYEEIGLRWWGSVCAVLVEVKLIVVCSMVGYSSPQTSSPHRNVCLFSFHSQKMLSGARWERFLRRKDKLPARGFQPEGPPSQAFLDSLSLAGAVMIVWSLNLGSKFGKWKSRGSLNWMCRAQAGFRVRNNKSLHLVPVLEEFPVHRGSGPRQAEGFMTNYAWGT